MALTKALRWLFPSWSPARLAVAGDLPLPAAGLPSAARASGVPACGAERIRSLREAEDLLDWLEAHGCADRQFRALEGGGFEVSWRRG